MSALWSPVIQSLEPYIPGEQPKIDGLIKLNTNENPYPPSPHVLETLSAIVNKNLKLYPDPDSEQLKKAIADFHHLDNHEVFLGNGSDEVLAHAFYAFFKKPHGIVFPDITYSFYPTYCRLYEIKFQTIPLTAEFEIDVEAYSHLIHDGIIFANPNAPTGVLLRLPQIRYLLDNNPNIVVIIDEAYIAFGGTSAVSLIREYPNLLVVRTLSKSHSLAGLRVGYALGQAHLITALHRVKNSFNSYPLDHFAQSGAMVAIQSAEYVQDNCQKIIASRKKLVRELEELCFITLPSHANFIFTRHEQKLAIEIASFLRDNQILIRHFNCPERIRNYLRITIGTDYECQQLSQKLKAFV